MIEVRFEEDREKGVLSMELRGHAGFAELGRDPVCAGASVLAMTLAGDNDTPFVKARPEAGHGRFRLR